MASSSWTSFTRCALGWLLVGARSSHRRGHRALVGGRGVLVMGWYQEPRRREPEKLRSLNSGPVVRRQVGGQVSCLVWYLHWYRHSRRYYTCKRRTIVERLSLIDNTRIISWKLNTTVHSNCVSIGYDFIIPILVGITPSIWYISHNKFQPLPCRIKFSRGALQLQRQIKKTC